MRAYLPHRWEREPAMLGFTCEAPPIKPRADSEYCPGCGLFIGDIELMEFWWGESMGCRRTSTLNFLAMLKAVPA